MAHWHPCTECSKATPCMEDCANLQPQGKFLLGIAKECEKCAKLKPCIRTEQSQTDLKDHTGNKSCEICNPIVYDQEWFDDYNGVVR